MSIAAQRMRSHWIATANREGAVDRPGSQETSLRPSSQTPSRKGVAHMPIRLTGLLCGAVLLVSAQAAVAAGPFDVSIRVEGKARTLVKERKVTLADAPIIKDGNPEHSCNGQAAIGALQAGTGGNWTGT